jgi:YD repeat-containing protein
VAREYYWGILDPSLPHVATDIISRTNPPPASDFDFDALIRRTLRNEPSPGKPHPSHAKPSSRMPVFKGDPVDLFTGAFTVSATDLVVPTAYIPIEMSRSYRSGRPYYGPFGFGWDHCYNVYLRELDDGSVALWTGQLTEQRFNFISGLFEPAPGFSARMEALPGLSGTYEVIYPGGRVWHFERPAGWTDTERIPLVSIRDRHGNTVELTYSNLNKLASVLDTDGRGLFFHYGSCNLLEQVSDHTRTRVVSYWHETEAEHLAGVILPASAQYPEGQTTSYEYDGYASHPAMQHNILCINRN